MRIVTHQLKLNICSMTTTDLKELINILGIPIRNWIRNYKKGEKTPYQLTYAYGDAKESVRLYLGDITNDDLMNTETREIIAYKHKVADGYEPFYTRVGLLLHGSFFDNSEFDIIRLLNFVVKLGFTATQLDIAFDDDKRVTDLKDWLRVFEKYNDHCIGNIIKRQPISIVTTLGTFERVQIGKASSSSMYGTLYKRMDETIRLELKLRNSTQIHEVLQTLTESGYQAYYTKALQVLVSSLEIYTYASKKTRSKSQYIRESFWQSFLSDNPSKMKWSKKQVDVSLGKQYDNALKTLTARIYSFVGRYSTFKPDTEIIDNLTDILRLYASPHLQGVY